MADTPTPAPAGAESAPTRLSDDQILEALGSYGNDGADDGETSEEAEPQETEPTDAETDAEPAGEDEATEAEGEEGEGPEDDASEPEQKETPAEDEETGSRVHRLRDGTQVTLADLKKGFDRAREFERVLPQVQQEHQRFQQEKQQFTAEKQQFQAQASAFAQHVLEMLPPEPDPVLMDQNSGKWDPMEYNQQVFNRQRALTNFNQKFAGVAQMLSQEAEQVKQRSAQQVQRERQTAVQRFFHENPEFQDPSKGQNFVNNFHKVADYCGWSREERSDVRDSRLYKMSWLAGLGMEFLESQQQQKAVTEQRKSIAAKKVASAPPVTPPAARQTAQTRDARVMQGNLDRLRKNRSSTDAQLAALSILPDKL